MFTSFGLLSGIKKYVVGLVIKLSSSAATLEVSFYKSTDCLQGKLYILLFVEMRIVISNCLYLYLIS